MAPVHETGDIEEFAGAVMALVKVIDSGQTRAFNPDLVAMMQLLGGGEALLPSEIADALGWTRPSVTRRIQALQSDGKVTIQPDLDDGRSYRVSLSDRGKVELDELIAKALNLFASWVEDWTVEELRTFSALARRLTGATPVVARDPRPAAWWRSQGL